MKKLLALLLFSFASAFVLGQTYNASLFTTSNKAIGIAQGVPTDARSYFYDAPNFVMRPYQSAGEALTYLNLSKYRTGQFPIVVNFGGILNSGVITGGVNTLYYFKNGTADSNLVVMIPASSGGTCVGCMLGVNNLSDVASVTSARSNLGLGAMAVLSSTAGGDLTGTWPAITVAQFNGQLPSYYLNYNNLFNTPTIPAQFNPIQGAGMIITGTYPNITFAASGAGFNTAGVFLKPLSTSTIGLDTQLYRKVDTLIGVNDSTLRFTLNGNIYNITLRGGVKGGSSGTGTVTIVAVVTANGISGSVSNATSNAAITLTLGAITPASVNGLTLTSLSIGFTIQGGTTSKTLTVPLDATVSGVNTGDVTLTGETYITRSGQVLTLNAVNLSGTNVTGTLAAARFPALTGPVTTSAGSLVTSVTANALTNVMLAQMGPLTVKGNNTVSTANAADLTMTQLTAMLNVFTTTLNGLVPNPGSIAGKVLGDNGTWVVNGAGNPNTNLGAGYRWAVPGTNGIKTAFAGYGIKIDSTLHTTALDIIADTNILQVKGQDSIFVNNAGPANSVTVFSLSYVGGDNVINFKKLVAGANINFSQNNDSSMVISASGGAGSGVANVGTINSQSPSANGLVISGTTIYAQYAAVAATGMVNTITQSFAGAKTFTSAPAFSTMTSNGGPLYTNGSGVVTQASAGTSVQVFHGGSTPGFSALNYATDGTGVLPVLNGGSGTSTPSIVAGANITVAGAWPNQTISATSGGTVTSISYSSGSTGLSSTGSPITTSGTITIGGDLNVAHGGTGVVALAPFDIIIGGATATGAVQQVSGEGTTNQVLLSQGPGAAPIWGDNLGTAALASTQVGFGSAGGTLTGVSGFTFDNTLKAISITTPTTSNTVYQSLIAQNAASATSGNQQFGGAFSSIGQGYPTSGPTREIGMRLYNKPITQGMAVNGNFVIEQNASNGAWTEIARIGSSANLTAGGTLSIGAVLAQFQVSAAQLSVSGLTSLNGSLILKYVDVSTTYSPSVSTDHTINCTTGTFTVTLPSTASTAVGQEFEVVNTGTGTITVVAQNGANFVGAITAASYTLTQGQFVVVQSQSASGNYIVTGSNPSGGVTPTLQQVITAGSTLTGNNNINTGTGTLTFFGTNFVNFAQGAAISGFWQSFNLQTTNYNATTTDVVVEMDATSGNRTVTLPNSGTGLTYIVRKLDATANTVTVNISGGGLIDGSATYVISSRYQNGTFISRGTGAYNIIGAYGGVSNTPNLQSVITAGATLSGNNSIFAGGILTFNGAVSFANGINISGVSWGISNTSTNATVNTSTYMVNMDASGGNRTVALPAASNIGASFVIKKIDASANTVTISVTGGTNIDQSTTYVLGARDQAVTVTSDGSNYKITAIANNEGAGVYTPSILGPINVSSSTPNQFTWSREGNVITVDGSVTWTPTSTSTACLFGISLPVTSNLATAFDLNGQSTGPIGTSGNTITGDATNDRAQFTTGGNAGTGSSATNTFHFAYVVK